MDCAPNLGKYMLEAAVILIGFVIGAAVYLLESPEGAATVLAMFLAAGSRLAPAVIRIQQAFVALRGNISQAEGARELIQETQDAGVWRAVHNEPVFKTDHEGFKPYIKVASASYAIPGTNQVILENVDINIQAGEFIAITGASGAGKSTLVDLFLGINKPTSGTVKIGGLLPKKALAKYPGAIAYVPQEIWLVRGSLADNLTLGFPQHIVGKSEIDNALENSQLKDLAEDLQNRDSPIDEAGRNLSGGQKQRVGFARALISNPKLIILDEATSKLDAETENLILHFLAKQKGKVTIVAVTHNSKISKLADRVIEVSNRRAFIKR